MNKLKDGHTLRESFNYAIEGIIDALKTERHMKVHAGMTFIVVILCILYGVTKQEIIALTVVISMVWMAELLNTAVENSIDIVCKAYHPLAKKAKDVAAGAVLVTSVNAAVVGYLVFHDKLKDKMQLTFDVFKRSYQHSLVMIMAIIVISVFVIKSFFKKGTPLQGGMPSGHSAIAASLWITVAFVTSSIKVFFLSMFLMLLVIQSRVEGKIHTLGETLAGALLGAAVTYLVLIFLGM